MVRGLKAKDLFKDDKVTLSTKWREKSLGNNPFECWRLGGTWPWLGGRIMAINAAGTTSTLVSFVFQHWLAKTAFNSFQKQGWAAFFPQRNLWQRRRKAKRRWNLKIEEELWKILCKEWQLHKKFTSNWKSGETCNFWHLSLKWGYLLWTFR